jgi:predicted peptidase
MKTIISTIRKICSTRFRKVSIQGANTIRYVSLIAVLVMLTSSVTQAADVVKLPDNIKKKLENMGDQFVISTRGQQSGNKATPLIIFLHGGVKAGNLGKAKSRGKLFDKYAGNHGMIAVMPYKGDGKWVPEDIELLIEHVKSMHKIDDDRLYLTGFSMGGIGTWHVIQSLPKTFAAAAPAAGAGWVDKARKVKHMPIWVFHGKKDTTVKYSNSVKMVEALKKAGAKNVKFTTYPDRAHNISEIYIKNDELFAWFAEQSKSK